MFGLAKSVMKTTQNVPNADELENPILGSTEAFLWFTARKLCKELDYQLIVQPSAEMVILFRLNRLISLYSSRFWFQLSSLRFPCRAPDG